MTDQPKLLSEAELREQLLQLRRPSHTEMAHGTTLEVFTVDLLALIKQQQQACANRGVYICDYPTDENFSDEWGKTDRINLSDGRDMCPDAFLITEVDGKIYMRPDAAKSIGNTVVEVIQDRARNTKGGDV